jgi:F0F1-type ATP synthase alpha subunit
MTELLKQPQFSPLDVASQVLLIFAGTNGYVDDVPVARVGQFEKKYLEYMNTVHRKLVGEIKKEGKISESLTSELKKATVDFKAKF